MKKLFVPALSVLCMQSAFAAEYAVNKITNNNSPAANVTVMANGDMAWYGSNSLPEDSAVWEVYLYKAQTKAVTQLTNNTVADFIAGGNGRGDVLIFTLVDPADYSMTYQLSLYNAATNSISVLAASVATAEMNDRGDVVWAGNDGNDTEIFLYQSSSGTISQLTDNATWDSLSASAALTLHSIDDNGNVVWSGYDVDGDSEVFLYNAATGAITQLTNDAWNKNNPTIGNGNVAWQSYDGTKDSLFLFKGLDQSISELATYSYEYTMNTNGDLLYQDADGYLWLYDSATDSTKAMTNSQYGWMMKLNAGGDAAWFTSGNVYKYNSATDTSNQISSGYSSFSRPNLSDNGDVTWGRDSVNVNGYYTREIFAFDEGTQTTVQIAAEQATIGWPQITGQGDVVWLTQENGSIEIYVATKVVATVQCEVETLPSSALAVNNAGQVLLYNGIWKDGAITSISIPGASFNPKDLNDKGQVVGTVYNARGVAQGYLWDSGTVTAIATLSGSVLVSSINNAGQVTGYYSSRNGNRAFLWSNGGMTDLGSGSGNQINNLGQIAGNFNGINGTWDNGTVLPFGRVPSLPIIASPSAINDNGQSVAFGFRWFPSYLGPVVLSENGVAKELPTLPSFSMYAPKAINNSGVIVGTANGRTGSRAFVIAGGVINDLSDMLPADSGWNYLTYAYDINDAGQIVGLGRRSDGTVQSFLMSGACLQ